MSDLTLTHLPPLTRLCLLQATLRTTNRTSPLSHLLHEDLLLAWGGCRAIYEATLPMEQHQQWSFYNRNFSPAHADSNGMKGTQSDELLISQAKHLANAVCATRFLIPENHYESTCTSSTSSALKGGTSLLNSALPNQYEEYLALLIQARKLRAPSKGVSLLAKRPRARLTSHHGKQHTMRLRLGATRAGLLVRSTVTICGFVQESSGTSIWLAAENTHVQHEGIVDIHPEGNTNGCWDPIRVEFQQLLAESSVCTEWVMWKKHKKGV